MKRTFSVLSAFSAAVFLMCSPMAQAEETGQREYMNACASCHGPAGLGNGPMAEFMSVKVPDLTQLSAQNDGVFPMLDVIQIVDGRTGVRGHGSEMPVYGDFFEGSEASLKTESGQPILTSTPVADLIAYIESVQKP